jgi:hypothetical protein
LIRSPRIRFQDLSEIVRSVSLVFLANERGGCEELEFFSMRTPIRAVTRLALVGFLGLAGFLTVAPQAPAAAPPENALPDSTFVFVKVKNVASLREAFRQSQFGQLVNDPALKPFRDDIIEKLDRAEGSKDFKEKLGVSIGELLNMPQGTAMLAVVGKENGDVPVTFVLSIDAGQKASSMSDVMTRLTKIREDAGDKIEPVRFKNLTIQVITPKTKDNKDDGPPQPMVWTREGSVFYFGSDVDTVKDLIANAGGREGSLASSETYLKAVKKVGSDAPIIWYADVAKFLQILPKIAAKSRNPEAFQQVEPLLGLLGLNGLKAVAGSYSLNTGNYDSVAKVFVSAPKPLTGLLKAFTLPQANLRPEPWVPSTVASYSTVSWDLDNAYTAINDLANSIQPGVLNVLEQNLVGPNGGEPLNLKKDIFGPLGNRITTITDFKKPVTEESQRSLFAIALDDTQAFQETLGKLINLSSLTPKKREFQGTTIYDFDLQELGNANIQVKGLSVAIAKNTLFISSEPTLLEQVLRGGGSSLGENQSYSEVAKEYPEKTSTMSFARPEESARVSYDMLKSGALEKALQGLGANGGADVSEIFKFIDKDKLPDFSVFAKYLSQGGGYSQQDEDGFTMTNFTLRKANP